MNVSTPPIDNGCSIEWSEDKAGLRIDLAGQLTAANVSPSLHHLRRILRESSQRQITFTLNGLSSLDDFGLAIFAGLQKTLRRESRELHFAGMQDSVAKVFQFHHFDAIVAESPNLCRPHPTNVVIRVGEAVLGQVDDLSFKMTFLGSTILSLKRLARDRRNWQWQSVVHYMENTGVDALPIVGLISFLLGLIMAFMSSVQLQQFGANIYVASLVSLSMTRELGPIMTAILVAGRSGSAYAAEIGSMKISEEIDALVTMGFDPYIFLVLPKIFAAVLVVPLLTLFSDLFAIIGGLLVGIGMLDLTVGGYVNQTFNTLGMFDVFWGVFKSFLFALLIAWVGCLRGFQVEGGAAGVGRATTSAVVSSIFLIILVDSFLAVILRYWE